MDNLILLAVLTQIMLTIAVYFSLGFAKSKAMKLGQVNEERRALHDDAWPDSVLKINNNIRNQFEVPILFYALIFILWGLQAVDITTHIIAWLFVISRLIHAYSHTGSNYVPVRRKAFSLGVLCVLALAILSIKAVIVS